MSGSGGPVAAGPMVLEMSAVNAGYGDAAVLRSVDLQVRLGSVVALLGANGAGKTTTLRVASGLLRPSQGSVILDGSDVTRASIHRRTKAGLCLIPEGRGIFRSLTVRDNLELQIPPWTPSKSVEPALAAFPPLRSRLGQVAGSLSGGEQQMLAMSRAYLSEPKVVLLDEVSMGLAPLVVDQIFESIRHLAASNVALVVVEQFVNRALEMADEAALMRRGEIVWTGPASELDEQALTNSYLGEGQEPVPVDPPLKGGESER
jgi:branched-chain amino acid transport system ATP-binding protein